MLSLIVAHDRNRCIGSNGDMPWGKSIKSDLKWFQTNTLNHVVLMGSHTYQSIGDTLPNRINVILTSKPDSIKSKYPFYTASSIDDFLSNYTKFTNEQFVIGGETLYKQFLLLADRLYITHIDAEFEGDTYFPEYDLTQYDTIYEEHIFDQHPLRFAIYQKK